LNFSWISSSEAGKFAEVATDVTEKVREVGPLRRLAKGRAKVV
jgi:coenzyme F420-reducing hydrogenase delta subunit